MKEVRRLCLYTLLCSIMLFSKGTVSFSQEYDLLSPDREIKVIVTVNEKI